MSRPIAVLLLVICTALWGFAFVFQKSAMAYMEPLTFAGVRYFLENIHAYADSNLMGFLNILEGCHHSKIEHLVFASSSSVYGNNTKIS